MLRFIVLLVPVLILTSPGASALAAEPGVIKGKVINGTANGSSVAGIDVSLQTYLDDTETSLTTTTTDAEGRFVFDGLSTAPGYNYQVIVTFQGADYYSQRISLDQKVPVMSAEVTVYDSTTSDEALMVEVLRTSIYLEGDGLRVSEFFSFINTSDLTYIGSGGETVSGAEETLRFSLPDGAQEVQPEIGLLVNSAHGSEDWFTDTLPVMPGYREVAYSYRIDSDTEAYEFLKKIYYPITTYNFLVEDKGINIITDQLIEGEPIFMKNTQFKWLWGHNFAPGDTIAIQLLKVPQPIQWAATVMWVALVLMVLTAVLIFVYWMKKGRGKPV